MTAVDLAVDLATGRKGGLRLRTPVMTAAGVYGYGTEYDGLVDRAALGAIVCPGTTLHPRRGAGTPRHLETIGGMLAATGNPNIGVRAVVRERAPVWASWNLPVLVNIAGETIEEFAEVAARLDGVDGVAGIEMDIGSASYAQLGERFGSDPGAAAELTAAVRNATSLPLLVKLPLGLGDTVRVARAVDQAGADGLTVGHGPAGLLIDFRRRRPALGSVQGGMSGPAIKPLGLLRVYELWDQVSIPIIGCGGIATPTDALEYLMAGASAVQVGAALFTDPRTPVHIVEGLTAYLEREGVTRLQEIVGTAHH
ncbi:MAG: dihydroorotate dehydrogenase [Chloroflexi bacterium]|nr:dihydroorotate dehydrogenase [Chloroflexota bacterium]